MTTTTDWANWNPWAPYADYEAYHAANFKIAQILGWETGGEAIKAAQANGVSTVYSAMLSGAHYVVTWSPETGATINHSDEAGNITGPVYKIS
jgi:hypothetical protein